MLKNLLTQQPMLALFLTLCLGYFVGKFRVKQFVLGGIAGSLLVGVLIGQLGIDIPQVIGTFCFALFIYAVGYQGGPQFFRSLNRKTFFELVSATITCILGLLCVLLAAYYYHLDRGTAAGLAAGGLTQSAIIGTAGDAIAKLNISPDMKKILQSNVAVGYAVCYIFGSFGPILLLATVFPGLMRWDLRKEAKQLARRMQDGSGQLEPGQFDALRAIDTRIFRLTRDSVLLDKRQLEYLSGTIDMVIETILRGAEPIDYDSNIPLQEGDILAITAPIKTFIEYQSDLGQEIEKPKALRLVEEFRKIVISNKDYDNQSISQLLEKLSRQGKSKVYLTSVAHLGERFAVDSNFIVRRGDEIELLGKGQDLDSIAPKLGYTISQAKLTDFVFFGLGMVLGILIGMIHFRIFGVSVTLGAGVGCLFSGLLFGWLRSTHPRFAGLPVGASNFLRDFGLAVFVSVIGITAGPQAIETIKQYGLELFLLGVGVTIIPQVISFYISYYLLNIKNPITLLATIAGGRSANPGFAALLEKAGNSTPVVPFTATYAIANILLTLWGPVIISLIHTNLS